MPIKYWGGGRGELDLSSPKVVKEKAGFQNHFCFFLTNSKILLEADGHGKLKNIKNVLLSHSVTFPKCLPVSFQVPFLGFPLCLDF